MSAERIDVLAVMHDCAIALANEDACGHAAELTDARAAVAELIAALKRALPTVEHMYHTNPDPDGSLWADVEACRAALALCGGAS